MTDPERPSTPPIPLETDGGEEDMHSFICAHIASILKPYADNVYELHKTVQHLSSNVCDLEEKYNVLNSYSFGARIDSLQEGQEKLKQYSESTRQSLDGFIDESGKIEQERAKRIQNLEETLALTKSDVEELRKNGDDMHSKLVACQDAEKENRENCVQLKNELQKTRDTLTVTDEAQAASIQKMDFQISVFQNKQNKELAQEQEFLRAKFKALNDESTEKLNSMTHHLAENQSQLKQYRKDFEQTRDATTQSLSGIREKLGRVEKEAQAKMDKIDTDLKSQIRDVEATGKESEYNLNQLLRIQGQQQEEDMKDVRRILGDLEAITSKHESEVTALQNVMEILPKRVADLEGEVTFTDKRNLRLEKALGLEPFTKEMADPKRQIRKRASSSMLGEDQTLRKAWSAWTDAIRELKNEKASNTIPNMLAMLKTHSDMLESEKSKLDSTTGRVQTLEVDHTKFLEEMQKLRKSLDLNDGYWKGMTRGLQSLKKTMHTEGDGEMLGNTLPSPRCVSRLRDALPPLTSSTPSRTDRPATSMS